MSAGSKDFHRPNSRTRLFLEIVVRGHAELQQQLQFCEVADYDRAGWLDVRTFDGPRSPIRYRVDGPTVCRGDFADPDAVNIGSAISVNIDGLLCAIEIVQNLPPDEPICDPIELFITADQDGTLHYPE
jgi:hypothetical protein